MRINRNFREDISNVCFKGDRTISNLTIRLRLDSVILCCREEMLRGVLREGAEGENLCHRIAERATTDPSEGQMLECRQHLDALYECT